MQNTNNSLPYVCRRCLTQPSFRTYDHLRGHLRAIHSIRQLSNDDLPLYEAFPGSRSIDQSYSAQRSSTISQQSTSSAGSQAGSQAGSSRPIRSDGTVDINIVLKSHMEAMEEKNARFQETLKTSISLALSDAVQSVVRDIFCRTQTTPSNVPINPPQKRDVSTDIDRVLIDNIRESTAIKPEPKDADTSSPAAVKVGNSSSDDELLAVATPELNDMVPVSQILRDLAQSEAEERDSNVALPINVSVNFQINLFLCQVLSNILFSLFSGRSRAKSIAQRLTNIDH